MNRRQMVAAFGGVLAYTSIPSLAESSEKSSPPRQFFDPRNFGAAGDGKALDSPAINAAIDACTRSGGGLVYLASGTYRSGTVILKSNVTLYLEAGATLLGSTDLGDYTAQPGPPVDSDANQRHLIFARDAENIGIAGPGRIDGQGPAYWISRHRTPAPQADHWKDVITFDWTHRDRPSPMLEFVNCRWLRIEDVRIENAPGWTLRPINCDQVHISGISVHNAVYGVNTDGMDLTGCHDVFVSNCSIHTGDDAICLKSENPYGDTARLSKNIVITNCVLTTCCNGLKIGTGTEGGFENITFSNSVIFNNRDDLNTRVIAGIALDIVDGGWLEGLIVSGIQMQRARTPIFLRLGARSKPHNNPQAGMRGIMIENIQASGAVVASSIVGLEGMEIEDVSLSNLRLDNAFAGTADLVNAPVPELPKDYPEARMFGRLPASGLYCRHANGLRLKDITFSATATEARPTIVCDRVRGLRISGMSTTSIAGTQPVIKLVDNQDAWISNSAAPLHTETYLEVSGIPSANVLLSGCDLRYAHRAVDTTNGADKQSAQAESNIL
jgi:polygalacturonase